MAYIVRMPKLGVEMQAGTVVEWHADLGEKLEEDDLIAEIESEKTVADVRSREAGVLRRILLEEDVEVSPGTPIGVVADEDEDIDDLLSEVDAAGVDPAGVDDAASADDVEDGTAGEPEPAGAEVPATPKARQAAAEAGVDLAGIEGSGPGGAVTETDVQAAAARRNQPDPAEVDGSEPARPAATAGEPLVTPRARKRAAELGVDYREFEGSGPGGAVRADDIADSAVPETASEAGRTVSAERELSGVRGTIARRLSESWTAPHVTVDKEVDVEAALEAADGAPEVVSVTDVILKAVSETLADHPSFNATLEDGVVTEYKEHNLGIAVDTDTGLITPVIHGVGDLNIEEVARRRRALVDRVRDRSQSAADLEGGTFTVSNLGVLGIDAFTPIINPPEVAILGLNRTRERPRRTPRGIEFYTGMTLSLSFDHRAVDGADAARFLNTLEAHLAEATELVA